MRLSACLLTIVAWNEFRTCPWSGYDTSHLSCTKDTHFHLGSCIDTEDRVQLQVVSAPSLFRLWLVTILCCLPNCPTSWFMKSQKEKRGQRLKQLFCIMMSPTCAATSEFWHLWRTHLQLKYPRARGGVSKLIVAQRCHLCLPMVCLKRRAGLQAWQQCHHEVPSSTCSHWSFPGVNIYVIRFYGLCRNQLKFQI